MGSHRTTAKSELASLAPPLAVIVALLGLATRHGADPGELALAGGAVLVTQIVPGALIWRLVRPVDGWLVEDIVVGFAVGAAMAVPAHELGVITDREWLDAAVPLLVAVVILTVPASRCRLRSRQYRPLPRLWGLATASASLVPALAINLRTPLRFDGWATPYVDVPYHLALAGEVMHRFPPHYPQTATEPLTYHWFAHAWTAQIATVSGTPLDVLLWRFDPALLVVMAPLLTAVAAMRLTDKAWSGPAAAVLTFGCLSVVPWAVSPLSSPLHTSMSPTQQFGLVVVLAVLVVLIVRWRGEAHRGSVLVLLLLLVVAGGSKGSTLPVLVAGCVLATLAVLLTRGRAWRRVMLDTALAIGALLGVSTVLFGGGSGGLQLDALSLPTDAVRTLTLVGAYAGAVALVGRGTRADPLVWLLLGAGTAGVGASVLLTHPGQSQLYFLFAAIPPLAIAAVWGICALLDRTRDRGRIVGWGALSGVVAFGVTYGIFIRELDAHPGPRRSAAAFGVVIVLLAVAAWLAGRRYGRSATAATLAIALATAGIVPTVVRVASWDPPSAQVRDAPSPGAIHHSDVQALRWLRDHSDPDDVVITNVHCLGRIWDECDRRRFVVGAYSELRVLVEGWAYTARAMQSFDPDRDRHYTTVPFWRPDLRALADGFISRPTTDAADELRRLGVGWVVVWHRGAHADDFAQHTTARYETQQMTIHELTE